MWASYACTYVGQAAPNFPCKARQPRPDLSPKRDLCVATGVAWSPLPQICGRGLHTMKRGRLHPSTGMEKYGKYRKCHKIFTCLSGHVGTLGVPCYVRLGLGAL